MHRDERDVPAAHEEAGGEVEKAGMLAGLGERLRRWSAGSGPRSPRGRAGRRPRTASRSSRTPAAAARSASRRSTGTPGRSAAAGTGRASRRAVVMPSATERRSAGTLRPTAARTTPKPVPLRPRPTSTPALKCSSAGLRWSTSDRRRRRRAGRRRPSCAPCPICRRSRRRTAATAPQSRFWIAIASANTSRPQPRSRLIGCRNRPKLERMPNDSSTMNEPHAIALTAARDSRWLTDFFSARPARRPA